MAKRSNPLDILSPVEDQPEEVKTAPDTTIEEAPVPMSEKGRPIDLLEAFRQHYSLTAPFIGTRLRLRGCRYRTQDTEVGINSGMRIGTALTRYVGIS